MSGNNMTAAFRLDFTVGSEPLQALRTILSEVNGSLKELARAVDPFAEMQQPIARATSGVAGLNEVLSETGAVGAEAAEAVGAVGETAAGIEAATAAVTGLDDALGAARGAAAGAASGLNRIGTEAEAAADRSVSALGRIRSAASALGSGGMGYARSVGGAVRGFGQSIQEGMGGAFGAAATGFGLVIPVKAAAEYDNTATHIGITLGKNGAENDEFTAQFKRQIDRTARQTGQRSADLMESASFFSMEGYSLDRIKSFLPTVAHISTAYNAHPDAVARTAFQLQENMGIGEKEMPQALAEIARVGKEAALPLEQLAPLFPQVAAQAGRLGVHGISGVADLAGFMAVIRKSAGSEGQALADFRAFMQTMTTKHGRHRYEKEFGVDPLSLMQQARHQGKDPLLAVLGNITSIKDQDRRERVVADLFANEMDQGFVGAVTGHYQQFAEIRERVGKTSPKMIDDDFKTGSQSTLIVLNAFEDALTQLERRIGDGFVPILKVATSVLHGLTEGFDWLDEHVPGATTVIIGATGGLLALATAAGAVGAVAGPLRAGFVLFRTVLAPVGALLGGVSLATLGVVAGLAALTVGVVAAALYVSRSLTRISHAFDAGGSGITGSLKGAWNVAKMVFNDFTAWLDGWGGGIGTKLHNIVTGLAKIFSVPLVAMFQYIKAQFAALDQSFSNSWVGRHIESLMGRGVQPAPAIPAAAPAHAAASGGQFGLHVSHDPGLKLRQTAGQRGAMRITPDRGRMVAQP
ncbi:phage tail tape measure protein [Komagataeibacter medellinensis]|uniref:Phage tail tape measure protein n=1 Tax=Komagataeibacter medellinensis TaxID=1177712 RepID=A0ABQ6VSC9_9PROT|nr:phage tail tape measure protein [Komagataeibacter medellinensis]KAB8123099.1 phage tail tape measure protein [Komagataeibacter medellinensis]